ncbi:MAG TPA: type II toxin-antitoxin system RelE/ParE family toxin [Reyranella sp.]|nr:type II toxin-antitoxin system RelE/ParE family toxin [Reyranella sp.]
MRIVRRRRAVEDIDEHAAYIAERNQRAAFRFLEKVEETFDLLARHPRIGSPRFNDLVPGLRAWPVVSFRSYVVLYFVNRGAVRVVRVVHATRDLEALFKGPWTELPRG